MSDVTDTTPAAPPETLDLLRFIDASPSPYHAVETTVLRLHDAGFREQLAGDPWRPGGGGRFLVADGALVAWVESDLAPHAGFRIIGAHTDSPNLRIKPRPDTGRVGYRQLGVDVYGGALVNSWLDRDLGLSGYVALRGRHGGTFRVDRPLLRVPQLAIHLDREIDQKGLLLNRQTQLVPVWGLGPVDEGGFVRFLADETGWAQEDILAWEVMAHDLTPAAVLGVDAELISAPRLDNLASCWAATVALERVARAPGPCTPVICLFDHEEVGSTSAEGAVGPLLRNVLERIVAARGGTRDDLHRGLAQSFCVSADMAHAVHPNYVERYEPDHHVHLNRGPVIKRNANQRYATSGWGAAWFRERCEEAGVPVQEFVNRSDLACGSTIGPLTAAGLGITTVDVGAAQLSMHSTRELAGSADPPMLAAALAEVLRAADEEERPPAAR